ncbi:MAG: hypothetical protein ABW252_13355 [Polyangiales bacterium]
MMLLVHGYLIAWLVGGVGLLTMLLLRTTRRPAGLLLALIGFGGAGFVAEGVGLPSSLQSAVLGAVIFGVVGYVLQPRTTREVAPPLAPEPPP